MATSTILVTQVELRLSEPNEQLSQHVGRASVVIESHNGRVAQRSGRGVTAVFASATDAVLAAVALHQSCERDARLLDAVNALRIGIHVADTPGADERHTNDSAVSGAERLCRAAAPGQLFISGLVKQLFGAQGDLKLCSVTSVLEGDDLLDAWEVRWAPLEAHRLITVVVAEDSVLVRAGVVSLLREEGFDVLAEVGDSDGLLAAARRHRPMLVVTDVRMPPGQSDEGIVAAAVLRSEDPNVGVLVLSQHIEPRAAALLLANNPTAVGYLLKERVSDLDEFINACRAVASGGVVIDPLVAEQLLVRRRPSDALDRLSPRELAVLDFMAQGRSNSAIARGVHCSTKTLETHIRSIFTKLDLPEDPNDHRRVAAVVRYLHRRS